MRILLSILALVWLALGYVYVQQVDTIEAPARHSTFVKPQLQASVDIGLTTADRDLNNLTPETKLLAEQFLTLAQEAWYNLFITEWLRSEERQLALYNKGRTQPWNIVTWTMNSRHLRGIAFDVAFQPAYHGSAYPEDPELREAIGEIGESLWLIRWWRWRRPDKPHFQNGW